MVSRNVSDYEENTYLLNTMCDLTQFFVTVGVSNILSVALSVCLFENILLKFRLCGLMVIDDGSNFKGIPIDVYEYLNISVYLLAKRNNKGLSVKYFHRVLVKTTTISVEDRGKHQSKSKSISTTTTFIWNSAVINNTDVI